MANTHSIDIERGSSQYLGIAGTSLTGFTFNHDFTIEGWINTEDIVIGSNNYYYLWRKNGGGSLRTSHAYIEMHPGTDNRITFQLSQTGSTNVFGYFPFTVTNGSWTHIAFVYDQSAGTIDFYRDGVYQSQATSMPTSVYTNTSVDMYIGSSLGSHGFDGKMDEWRFWDDIRTADEIANNMNKELVGNEANLQMYYKFNNDALDSTSNNNDLTLYNSPVYSTDVAFTGASVFIPKVVE